MLKVARWALLNSGFGLFMFHGNHVVYCRQNCIHGNQVGLDCLCIMAIKFITLDNYGNQLIYFKAKTTYRRCWF
jgi:hypothetical protein